MPLTPDILLSTGRIVKHTPGINNSERATPTPGTDEMTEAEWIEYCGSFMVYTLTKPKLKTAAALRVQDLEGRTL